MVASLKALPLSLPLTKTMSEMSNPPSESSTNPPPAQPLTEEETVEITEKEVEALTEEEAEELIDQELTKIQETLKVMKQSAEDIAREFGSTADSPRTDGESWRLKEIDRTVGETSCVVYSIW